MALTSTQVLGAIVAPRAPLFTGPHRLTVQDCGARLAHSSGRLAHPSADRVIDSFPDPSAAPRPEIMIGPCAKLADHAAAVSKHRHCELRNKSHSRSHAECVWRDARHVWGREPAAPSGSIRHR